MLQWVSWCQYTIFFIISWQSGGSAQVTWFLLISFNPHESVESIAALQIDKYFGLIGYFSGTKCHLIFMSMCAHFNVHTVYMFVNIWDLVLDENC